MSEIYIRLFLTVARAIENKKDGGTKKPVHVSVVEKLVHNPCSNLHVSR